MNRLLRVSARRMFRDKIFCLAVAATFIISLLIILTDAPTMAEWAKAGDDVALENCFFNFAPLIGLVMASFSSLFLGVEYSDGTLRNKLISGHSRTSVFLSFWIITSLGCAIITIAWFLASLTGLHYLDFAIDEKTLALWIVLMLCSAVFYSAIYTTLSLLITNKAVSSVSSLVLWFILLFAGSIAVNTLCSEPYSDPAFEPDAQYVVLQIFNHILPSCPVHQMSNGEMLGNPYIFIATQLATAFAVLLFGCLSFRRKDLK